MAATSTKYKETKYKQKPSMYQPLPPGPFTRVLTLEPGHGDQMIFGRLEIVELDEALDFEAISYVWGSKRKRKTIFCNEVPTRLTQNLLEALRRIRHPSKPRVVWADAICINQDDNAEKGHQVAFMGQIYSRARRVLIHMAGEDEGHAPRVASLVADVECMVRLTLKDIGHGCRHFPWPDQKMRKVAMEDSRWASFAILSQQPWFQRGWVTQEAGLAQSATILWGPRTEIDWQMYMRCMSWLKFRALSVGTMYGVKSSACHDVLYFHQRRDELRAYRDTGIGIDTLLSVLTSACYVCFTDPRDRIFAFSDLAQHVRRWSGHPDDHKSPFSPLIIEPNYTKSKEDVYTDLARQYLQKRGVEILQCIQHTEHTLLDNNVPSWAPRWDRGMWHAGVGWGSPGLLLPEPPPSLVAARPSYLGDFMDEKILVARGVIFDKVTGSQLRFNPEEPSRYRYSQIDVFAFWRAMLSRKRGEAFDTYDLASKFLETLATGGIFGDWVEEWAARDQYCTFLTRWAEGTEGLQGDVEPEQLATPI